MDGRNPAPLWNHGKPLLFGIYREFIIPLLLRWCETNFVHPQYAYVCVICGELTLSICMEEQIRHAYSFCFCGRRGLYVSRSPSSALLTPFLGGGFPYYNRLNRTEVGTNLF